MINFALSNWKRAPLCERLTLLLSCEGVAFVTRLHSVANFCNKSQVTQFQNVWKTVLWVTPYIRVKRGGAGV